MSEILCRKEELELFQDILKSNKAELVAVIGRRRVGKTFIIREFFKDYFVFEFAGMYKTDLETHMQQFAKSIGKQFYSGVDLVLQNWFKAFDQLETAYDKLPKTRKKK